MGQAQNKLREKSCFIFTPESQLTARFLPTVEMTEMGKPHLPLVALSLGR